MKVKMGVSIDSALIELLDHEISIGRFKNRSNAVEFALMEHVKPDVKPLPQEQGAPQQEKSALKDDEFLDMIRNRLKENAAVTGNSAPQEPKEKEPEKVKEKPNVHTSHIPLFKFSSKPKPPE